MKDGGCVIRGTPFLCTPKAFAKTRQSFQRIKRKLWRDATKAFNEPNESFGDWTNIALRLYRITDKPQVFTILRAQILAHNP